jgi:putative membrane protein
MENPPERSRTHPASLPDTHTPAETTNDPAFDGPAQAEPKLAPPLHTRTSAAFKAFAAGTVVLLLLLIFILENTQSVKISYFGATGHMALGVALLLAAVGGALLIAVVGTARISQLRKHARRRGR